MPRVLLTRHGLWVDFQTPLEKQKPTKMTKKRQKKCLQPSIFIGTSTPQYHRKQETKHMELMILKLLKGISSPAYSEE